MPRIVQRCGAAPVTPAGPNRLFRPGPVKRVCHILAVGGRIPCERLNRRAADILTMMRHKTAPPGFYSSSLSRARRDPGLT